MSYFLWGLSRYLIIKSLLSYRFLKVNKQEHFFPIVDLGRPYTETTSDKQYCLSRLLVSAADWIYVLIARRPHTGATSQHTNFAGKVTSAQTTAYSIFEQVSA